MIKQPYSSMSITTVSDRYFPGKCSNCILYRRNSRKLLFSLFILKIVLSQNWIFFNIFQNQHQCSPYFYFNIFYYVTTILAPHSYVYCRIGNIYVFRTIEIAIVLRIIANAIILRTIRYCYSAIVLRNTAHAIFPRTICNDIVCGRFCSKN